MKLETPIKILVRRRAAVGDVIMSTAVVKELSTRYGKNALIDVVTQHPEVYRNNFRIRNIWHVNSPPDINDYELYINLDDAYENNPSKHFVDSMFERVFGQLPADRSMDLHPDAQVSGKACSGRRRPEVLRLGLRQRRHLGLQPGIRAAARQRQGAGAQAVGFGGGHRRQARGLEVIA